MVLITKNTRVIVQGMTGHQGAFHSGEMIKFGTNVVAGVSPGKAGGTVNGIKIYETVMETLELMPEASMLAVPAPFVRDAAFEAIDNGLKLIDADSFSSSVFSGSGKIYSLCLYRELSSIITLESPAIILSDESIIRGFISISRESSFLNAL